MGTTRDTSVPKDNKEYKTREYWNKRYESEETYDWLAKYQDVAQIMGRCLQMDDRILVIGCGNSTFSADLYEAGYRNITNLDFSEIVIDRMREKHKNCQPDMKWICGDMTKLTEIFDTGSFDVVIDKAAMDAIMVDVVSVRDPSEEIIAQAAAMCGGIHKVLDVTGVFIQISFEQPLFRKRFLMGDDLRSGKSRLRPYKWTFEFHPIDVGLGYFMYVCKKLQNQYMEMEMNNKHQI